MFAFDDVETVLRIWSGMRMYIHTEERQDAFARLLSYFNVNESELRFEALDRQYYEIPPVLDR